MFNKHDITRDACMLTGGLASRGYDWWWHSFTGHHIKTKEEKSFFIEFFLINPEKGTDHPVFGQLEEHHRNGILPSYLMVKAGAWGKDAAQLHRFFGITKASIHMDAPFSITADDCFLNETETHGHIFVSETEAQQHQEWMCQSGEIEWNLSINKQIAFNVGYGADKFLRDMQAFNMFWHAEGMKSAFSGSVTYNGETYIVEPETCYGYADKNWGSDFTSPWVWLSSNDLISEKTGEQLQNSVFDIGGGCPKAGPISFPRKLLSAVYYEGQEYEFNFSIPRTNTHTEFSFTEDDTTVYWHVEQRSPLDQIICDVSCKKEDMLFINYEAPDGHKRHNHLYNGGNGVGTLSIYHRGRLVDRLYARHIGCEYGEYDTESETK